MGNEHSSSPKSNRQTNYSGNEVAKLLEQQKALFDQKYAELLRASRSQSNSASAQQAAREAARIEVQKIMQEKQEQLIRQNSQLNSTDPPMSSSGLNQKSTTASSEFTGNPKSLYPNINEAGSSSTSIDEKILTAHVPRSIKEFPSAYPSSPLTSLKSIHPGNNDEDFVFVNKSNDTKRFGVLVPLPKAVPSAPPKPRSGRPTRSRAFKENTYESGDSDLSCPTCNDQYGVYIYQCQKGHSSCVNCKTSCRPCGLCDLPITDMRNITLEAYVGERTVSCKNSADGCVLQFKLADMDSHLKECPFKEMACPLASIFGQCTWRGKASLLLGHFDNVHQIHRQANVDTEMKLLNVTNDNHIVYLVPVGTFNFMFHVKICEQTENVYFVAQFIGTKQSASKWAYEVQVYNKKEPRRNFQSSDVCQTISTPLSEIINVSNCITLPLVYAKTFINEDCLTYKIYIRKERDENSGVKHFVITNDGNRQRIFPMKQQRERSANRRRM